MLHVEGTEAYINDNIIDVIGGLMTEEDGDFWVEKFTRNNGVERWIARSIKKWERKWGKKYFPKMLLIPFAVGLHYRLFIWNTHNDRVVYVAPFKALKESPNQEWMYAGIKLCSKLGIFSMGLSCLHRGMGWKCQSFQPRKMVVAVGCMWSSTWPCQRRVIALFSFLRQQQVH